MNCVFVNANVSAGGVGRVEATCPARRAAPLSLRRFLCAAAIVAVSGTALVRAQDSGSRSEKDPRETSTVSPALRELIQAPYLSDDEKRELRVRHGLWTIDDVTKPRLAAKAALIRGAYDDASLRDLAADAEDRAEAMLFRGEVTEALKVLDEMTTARALRLRAQGLIDSGKFDEASTQLDALLSIDSGSQLAPGDADVEIARGVLMRLRLQVANATPITSDEVEAISGRVLEILKIAREKHDRLGFAAPLLEAQVLAERDNHEEASQALQTALSFNPRLAIGIALAGESAAAQFDFPRAAKLAARLDELGGPGSPEGTLLLARLRLKQNDPEAAEKLLSALLDRIPRQRDALALRAAAAAARFDDVAAKQRLTEFDLLWPTSPLALLEVGKTLSAQRQYEAAAEALRRAAARAPRWPEPAVELGLLFMQAGRDDDAVAALELSQNLDPYNVRSANSLKLAHELRSYARFESEHFIVRCKPGIDEVLGAEMLAPLEALHARVTGNGPGGIDFRPLSKTTIDLMPDHAWFAVRITGMPAVHTIAASTGPVVAMEAPRAGAGSSMGPYDWARVLQHEYTHTVTLARTKNRLPHWFTEAAAVYLEDAPRTYDRCQLLAAVLDGNALFDFDQINIAFIRPTKPSDRGQAYAQGHWMYEFMMERFGSRAPLDLMDRYAAGDREATAMKTVLGVTREEFLDQFKVWAGDQLIAWGLRVPEGTPTLLQLLKEEANRGAAPGQSTDEASSDLPQPTAEMVERWLQIYPNHPQVLNVAVAMAMDRSLAKAIEKAMDRPIENAKSMPNPRLVANADATMAPLLERYSKARPVDPLPHKLLAKLALDSATPRDAISHLEYLDVREQNSISFAVQLAKLYAADHEWSKAIAKAERATRIAPYDPASRELAATLAIAQKDYANARRHLTALSKLEPNRAAHRQRLEALTKLEASSK